MGKTKQDNKECIFSVRYQLDIARGVYVWFGTLRNEEGYQIKIGHSTPLINDLEIEELFEDKDKEEGAGITDLINKIV